MGQVRGLSAATFRQTEYYQVWVREECTESIVIEIGESAF